MRRGEPQPISGDSKKSAKKNARNTSGVTQKLTCPSCGGDYSKCHCSVVSKGNRRADSRFMRRQKRVPQPRLVGVELNPGPPKTIRKKATGKQPMRGRRNRDGVPGLNSRAPMVTKRAAPSARRLQKSLVVTEEEYIADLTLTSAGFTNIQYQVNPGNSITFPWLSSIAANFNKYKFTKLAFRYEPIASGFSTPGQTGDVILSFNPDASDPAPVAQVQVYDLQMKDNGMPCDYIELSQSSKNPLRLAEINKQDSYYVRVGAQPANTDIKTYDVGNLNLSTIGTYTSGVCGKLFVSYSCLLHSPILVQNPSGGVLHFSSLTSTSANNFAGMTLQVGGTPALAGITVSGNTITWPSGIPGNYLVTFTGQAATSWAALSVNGQTGGVSGFDVFGSANAKDATYNVNSLGGTTTNGTMFQSAYTVTSAGGTAVYNAGTITTSGTTAADLWIVLLPASVLTTVLPLSDVRVARLEERVSRLMGLLSPIDESKESECDIECHTQTPNCRTVPLSSSMLGVLTDYVSKKSMVK